MSAVSGAAMKAFMAAGERGELPAASPYMDLRSGDCGLAASGVPVTCVEDLAWSQDWRERAAAAVMACTNVARAAEQQDSGLRFPRFERRRSVRIEWMRITHHACDQPGGITDFSV